MKIRFTIILLALLMVSMTGSAVIMVTTAEKVGHIKAMNGVNNGPMKADISQIRDNFTAYKAARIPFARTHDSSFEEAYGSEHTVDITAIFPDFSKDANDPKSYDFDLTDFYLSNILDAGTEVFFRLGQRIHNAPKKYDVFPPKDFKKWAVICEHIIRHYNEGWADGHHWNIRYWEIWNEADLSAYDDVWIKDPRTWGGTEEQFHELFIVTARHLKKCFPNLKIGGPALAGYEDWGERFIKKLEAEHVPLDFYSWHVYAKYPWYMSSFAERARKLLDDHGYKECESVLSEWNYLRGWTEDFVYTVKQLPEEKGASFVTTVMTMCQDAPVDILLYYDARISTIWNGLFDLRSLEPAKTYYAFYAWSKLAEYGTQVKVTVNRETEKDIYVTAATADDGKTAVMVTRFNEDNNVVAKETVQLKIDKQLPPVVKAHLTDDSHIYTEIPLETKGDSITLKLQPNAFMVIDL